MKIMILGCDGYIGYPLMQHLLSKGHEIFGIDNFSRRQRVRDIGGESLYLLRPRICSLFDIIFAEATLGISSPTFIRKILSDFKPQAIIHLAEQPSAPWSMADPFKASITQQENVIGTLHLLWAMKEECPDAHLIKLGTMGEYGTPECDIPEGTIPNQPCAWSRDGEQARFESDYLIELKRKCPMSSLLFPRTPGSFYHLSKVHDTYNIHFACRNWGLNSTDIMQGVVFGLNETDDPSLLTRFDYDEFFGTVINRFCAQAIIGHPLTVYGKGNQQRGFLPLKDSIQCIEIALNNPPAKGEYRTFNQFENVYSINHLADMVARGAKSIGLNPGIKHLKNPRKESEDHYYNPTCKKLFDLGYKPSTNIQDQIVELLIKLIPYKDRVIEEVIMPKVNWR